MQSPTILEVILFWLSVPTLALGYPMSGATHAPVYGTKRYNRPASTTSGLQRTGSLAWRQPRYYPAEQAYAGVGDSQEDAPASLAASPAGAAAAYYYYPDARRRRYQQQQQQPQYLYHPARYLVNDPVEDLEDTMRREEEGWYDDSDDATVLRPLAPADYYPAYYAKYNPRVRQQQQSFFPEDYYYDSPYDWYRPQQPPLQPARSYIDELQHEAKQQQQQQLSSAPAFRHYERSPYDYTDADEEDDAWINWGSKRSPGAKPKPGTPAGTSAPGTAIGQKEIVQPRPAVQPFRMPDFLMDDEDDVYHEKRSAPGVYNTIRRLIAMEKDLEQENDKKAPLKKRFVASGEDFVQELNSLKKRRA